MISPNTEAYERDILIDPSGFREYDARWRFPEQLNLRGAQALGQALGTLIHEQGVRPDIVVGHDYRSYSATVKQGLIIGLMSAGCRVYDIGLCLSPVAYFAQFELDCPCVAMVTASHNENGWTGVKMGIDRPLTFGPEMMTRLKEVVGEGEFRSAQGEYKYISDIGKSYIDDLVHGKWLKRKLKIVTACGNGTAGIYAPEALRRIGCEVIPMDCDLDYTFPRYNPNPEDMKMLHALAERVRQEEADIGFGFDGDGDRCGVVDNTGEEIFADKIGVLLARSMAKEYKKKTFVVDVKSTGLYKTDPVLKNLEVETDYWITGHSYIKRRVKDLNALAGFEKSGHFFFNAPAGRGYDDGILSAIMICRMLDRHKETSLSDLKKSLPKTWSSPTMSPYCPDGTKYTIVEKVLKIFEQKMRNGEKILNQKISDILSVNGARIVLEDGTWGLIRASSNKPCLVVVVESPVSELMMHNMFSELEQCLAAFEEVGEYDQKLKLAA